MHLTNLPTLIATNLAFASILVSCARIEKDAAGHVLSPYSEDMRSEMIRRDGVFTEWGGKIIDFNAMTCNEHQNGKVNDIFWENAGTNIGRPIGIDETLYYHGFVTEENVERSPRTPFSILMDPEGWIQLRTYPRNTLNPPEIMVQFLIKSSISTAGKTNGWYINAQSPSTCIIETKWRPQDIKGIIVKQQTITNLPPR